MAAQFWFRVAVMFLLAFAGGCGGPEGDLTAVFGSEYGIDTVRNATTVKAFRLKSPAAQHEVLSDYEMITGPLDVTGQLMQGETVSSSGSQCLGSSGSTHCRVGCR